MNWTPEEQRHVTALANRFYGLYTAYSWAPRSQLLREQVCRQLAEEAVEYAREQELEARWIAAQSIMDSLAAQAAGMVRDAQRTHPQGLTEAGWAKLQEKRGAGDAP